MIETFYLNRPQVANAFDLDTARALKKALGTAVKAKKTAFVIASQNPKIFCSGGDLQIYSKLKNKKQGVAINREIKKILDEIKTLPIFTVALIEGDVVGGGCELALACDFIFATPAARFAFKQVNQNLTPGWGGGQKLLARVHQSVFFDWLSSGRWITATEGIEKGLVDEVAGDSEISKKVESFVNTIVASSQLIGVLKEMAYTQGAKELKRFEELWWSKPHLAALNKTLKG